MSAPQPIADCVFCRIAAGDLPADTVHRTDQTIAFRDLQPQAPTHVLVVPRDHHANAAELAAADPAALADLVNVAAAVAASDGLGEHYRLVFNTGADAGQSVFHTHLHLLGGRPMSWPPG